MVYTIVTIAFQQKLNKNKVNVVCNEKLIPKSLATEQNLQLHLHECCHGVCYLTWDFQEWQQVQTLFRQLQ
jgi:hypothetical protein